MINLLIADDNINYAINLMNYLNMQNKNVKISHISRDGIETIDILNSKNDIDIVLIDYIMPFYNADQILENIQNKEKYNSSCIVISGEISNFKNLEKNELIYTFMSKAVDLKILAERVNCLIQEKEHIKTRKMVKNKIKKEILFLGYDLSHKGTQYLIQTIDYIVNNNCKGTESLEKHIYPIISKMYNDTSHNIKCRINRATEAMYYNCDMIKLKDYFNLQNDTKPKVKTIINTIIDNIRS